MIHRPTRPINAIKADLDRVTERIAELRKDPAFVSCHSSAAQEHSWCSRRLASLRQEHFEATGGRGPQPDRPTARY